MKERKHQGSYCMQDAGMHDAALLPLLLRAPPQLSSCSPQAASTGRSAAAALCNARHSLLHSVLPVIQTSSKPKHIVALQN